MTKSMFLYNEVFLNVLYLCVNKSQSKLLLMFHFWEPSLNVGQRFPTFGGPTHSFRMHLTFSFQVNLSELEVSRLRSSSFWNQQTDQQIFESPLGICCKYVVQSCHRKSYDLDSSFSFVVLNFRSLDFFLKKMTISGIWQAYNWLIFKICLFICV